MTWDKWPKSRKNKGNKRINLKKKIKKAIYSSAKIYEKQLFEEVNQDWEDYRIYKSISFNCERCPDEKRQQCIGSKSFEKMADRHVWGDYL